MYSKPITVNTVYLLGFVFRTSIVHDGTISVTIYKEYFLHFLPPVMFAYEQCLLVLGHHPDIWYEAAQYLEQSSKLLAEKGVSRLPLVFFLISLL